MTLSFSTKWPQRMGELAGQPNYFIEKIWSGLEFDIERDWSVLHSLFLREHKLKMNGKPWDDEYPNIARAYRKKRHTIREDKTNRWKAGNDIHFIINNRTKDRFQFAPVDKCRSVQHIEIKEMIMTAQPNCIIEDKIYTVRVDNKYLSENEIDNLAINDGFPDTKSFFRFFKNGFKGKIIHWTDLKY